MQPLRAAGRARRRTSASRSCARRRASARCVAPPGPPVTKHAGIAQHLCQCAALGKTRVAGLSLGVSAQRCAFASLQIDSLLCVVCVNLVDSVDLLFRKLQYASGACTAPQRHPLDLCMEPRSGAPSASGVQASVRVPGRPALARRPNRAPRGAQALRPSPAACATAPAAGAGMPGPAPAVASPPAPASAAAAPDPGSASLLQVRAVLARTTSTYPRHVHSW